MGHLNERGWINVATLAVYVPLLAGTLFTLIRQRFRMKSFYYLLTFILVKFVGATMTIDVQLNNNTSLYTPAAILSTVVLTPLIMAVAEIINLKHAAAAPTKNRTTRGLRPLELVNRGCANNNNNNNNNNSNIPSAVPPAYTPSPSPSPYAPYPPSPSPPPSLNKPLPPAPPPRTARLTRLAHLSILLSLGLGVAGGLRVFATAPSSSDLSSGRTYMRGAAGLAALALVLVGVNAAGGLGVAGAVGGRWMALVYRGVLGAGLPALGARVVYTVGVAVDGVGDGQDGQGAISVWDPVRGSWVLYLCLAWVPEVVVGVVVVGLGCLRPRREA